MQTHPVAELFPLMPADELRRLADDIKANGLLFPIITLDGMVLDGRNRLAACELAGVEPRFEPFTGSDPLVYVVSVNLLRRHLTYDQRVGLALKLLPKLKEEAEERTGGRPPKNGQKPLAISPPVWTGLASERAAALTDTGDRQVREMAAAEEDRPDLADRLIAGETKVADVRREIKKEAAEAIRQQAAPPPEGKYSVVVVDPPWPMEKIERECRPNQVAPLDYPTMTIEEIKGITVPSADDCHMWLWTTHRFLPDAFDILEAWGFRYVCAFVWHKPGGFQPVGLPQYDCEFALYARKGSPKFADTKDFNVCFNAPRGKHSEKPEEFYATLRRVTAGRRLDMFNRRQIAGFDSWGNEA